MDLTVYTVGPISGLSYDECVEHFNVRKDKLKAWGYDVLHPMLGKEFLRNELSVKSVGYDNQPICTNHAIVQVDFWRVDQADILFVDFTKAADRVSIGSVAEMSRGFQQGKLIITVMPKENIHQHAFVIEMSSIIFETLDEAFIYFERYKDTLGK